MEKERSMMAEAKPRSDGGRPADVHVEVQQRADLDAARAEAVTKLSLMDWQDNSDRFNLQDELVSDDAIRLETVANRGTLKKV
jgi:hypothetical protein